MNIKHVFIVPFLVIFMSFFDFQSAFNDKAISAVRHIPEPAINAGYNSVVFKDDFDELDISPDGGGAYRWFNNIFIEPPVSLNAFSVSSGIFTAKTMNTMIDLVAASSITTWPRKSGGTATLFQFGYFEAKMRFKPGQYNWPAFWLLDEKRPSIPNEIGKGKWCEIDIYEGSETSNYWGTVHAWKDFKSLENQNQHFPFPKHNVLSDWNIYGVLWQPGKVTWYMNGLEVGSAQSPPVCDRSRMFMILGAQRRTGSINEERLDVDWIRVYR